MIKWAMEEYSTMGAAVEGYYRNKHSQLIRLNHLPSSLVTGCFCCAIPNAHMEQQLTPSLCVCVCVCVCV